MVPLVLAAAVLLCTAGGGLARQLPGQSARAFASAGQVYPAMEAFCTKTYNTDTNSTDTNSTDTDSFESDLPLFRPACIHEPLRIGAWNLQRFGRSKMDSPKVVEVIVEVIHNYDLIVFQEVTDSSGTAIPALMAAVNQGLDPAEQYAAHQGPRTGRSSYKEQYVFIFKQSRLSFVSGYKYRDIKDVFQIEPYVARFTTENAGTLREFGIIPLHAKPSDAVKELDALVDVYDEMVQKWGLADALIVGDFNAGCNYIVQGEYKQIRLYTDRRFHWLISDHADTTTKTTSCPYDRIVVAGAAVQLAAYYKTASTYYFDEALGIEANWTLVEDISDHYPVGVMLRGTVPPRVLNAYPSMPSPQREGRMSAAFTAPPLGIRIGVSVDLAPKPCWAPVLALTQGYQATPAEADACQRDTGSGEPSVMVLANIALVEWQPGTVDAALTILTQLAQQHPQLVTAEAVAVLGYKAGHSAISDFSLYMPEHEPQDVVLTLLCHSAGTTTSTTGSSTATSGAQCHITLSASTRVN